MTGFFFRRKGLFPLLKSFTFSIPKKKGTVKIVVVNQYKIDLMIIMMRKKGEGALRIPFFSSLQNLFVEENSIGNAGDEAQNFVYGSEKIESIPFPRSCSIHNWVEKRNRERKLSLKQIPFQKKECKIEKPFPFGGGFN